MRNTNLLALAVWLSFAITGVGVYFQFGLGWALIAFGVASAVVLAFLVDIEEGKT